MPTIRVKVVTLDKRCKKGKETRLWKTSSVEVKSLASLITSIVETTPDHEEVLHITLIDLD